MTEAWMRMERLVDDLKADNERLREALGILSIRVLQSELILDEKESAARQLGVELHIAALQENSDGDW